jgi:transposase-like protein
MSSKKITDADKLEIVDLYRQSGDTTASLAIRYGVSNSTISRLLKTSIPETEYEILIQQKRGSKVGNEAESLVTDNPSVAMPTAIPPELEIDNGTSQPNSFWPNREDPAPVAQIFVVEEDASPPASMLEDSNANNRRVRRRSSAPLDAASFEPIAVESLSITGADPEIELPPVKTPAGISAAAISISGSIDAPVTDLPTPTIVPPPIPRTPVLREILSDSKDRYATPPVIPLPVAEISIDELEEEDSEPEDVNALAAMFGEEVADDDDDDDDSDDDDDAATDSSSQQLDRNKFLTEDRLHVQVTPLSQATLPRTCYIVIDKFAELIVRPLKDFADLGQISGEEIQQRTLPVFDNHRVAKRFSNQRTQRVIKVPDSRVFHKTTQHLRSKGITRLLVDGNIYSLN